MTAAAVFIITYIGIAVGRIPGLAIDRVGIALLGAIAMVVLKTITVNEAITAIDFPTILLLFGLMIVSAQLRLGGFYSRAASRIMFLLDRPRLFLFNSMLLSGGLSALLANDIVCFAFTPVLALSLTRSGLNPLPFLLGLAISSNIGSAATIIGNPQNMLIGQVGRLDFGAFLLWCGPPSILALLAAYLVLILIFRNRFTIRDTPDSAGPAPEEQWPAFDLWQSGKGIAAVVVLVMLFFTPVPREVAAMGIAGLLLCSRKMRTRDILVLVDWHLIILFCALFIVIQAVSANGLLDALAAQLGGYDGLRSLPVLTGVSGILSNMVSNVPATMILVKFLDQANHAQWYTLAVSSTFAGNLVTIGSIANLIVIEQAARYGVKISFRDHAAAGIPVTLVSFAVLLIWISL